MLGIPFWRGGDMIRVTLDIERPDNAAALQAWLVGVLESDKVRIVDVRVEPLDGSPVDSAYGPKCEQYRPQGLETRATTGADAG